MQTYGEYSPTPHDQRGAFLDDDRQHWLVVGLIQTRDSECLEQSNFATALDMLGGESDSVEVHRFGHWGPGWFEIILINPEDKRVVQIAEEIEASLSDYPVLDDEDFSRREWEESEQDWDNWARKDFIRKLVEDFGLKQSAEYLLDEIDSGELRRFCDEHSAEYCPINLRSFRCDRDTLAKFLAEQKRVVYSAK